MKKTKIMALLLSATLVFSGCGNMNNTAKEVFLWEEEKETHHKKQH